MSKTRTSRRWKWQENGSVDLQGRISTRLHSAHQAVSMRAEDAGTSEENALTAVWVVLYDFMHICGRYKCSAQTL